MLLWRQELILHLQWWRRPVPRRMARLTRPLLWRLAGAVQYNFDATVLDARGGDADTRAMTGLHEEVQANLAGCWNFERWFATMICRIEQSSPPLHTISIYCQQGRHRSVAAAEILKQLCYKNARVTHLTIDRRQRK